MKVVTAPQLIDKVEGPKVFLAGGITGCQEWQDQVIELLKDFDKGVLFNPRRKDFDITDPNASRKQITWEFKALHAMDIFSMFFCNTPKSDQPICFYELGKYVEMFQDMGKLKDVLIGVESGFKREEDVRIQMELIDPKIVIVDSLEKHAENIKKAVEGFKVKGESRVRFSEIIKKEL